MVLVPLLGRSEQAAQRSRAGRLQARKPTRHGSSSKLAKRPTSECFQADTKSPKALKNKNWRARRDGSSTAGESSATSGKENTRQGNEASQSNPSGKGSAQTSNEDERVPPQGDILTSNSEDNTIRITRKLDLLSLSGRHRRMCLLEGVLSSNSRSSDQQIKNFDLSAVAAKIKQVRSREDPCEPRASARHSLARRTESSHQATDGSADGSDNEMAQQNSHEIRNLILRVVNGNDHGNAAANNEAVIRIDDKQRLNTAVPHVEQQQQYAALHNRDAAFKKIIERLNGKKLQGISTDGGGREYKWQHQDALAANAEAMLRKPVIGNGRRNATNSDFRIDYWDHESSCHDLTVTTDSDSGTEVKHNNLNPRAREFLSLGYSQNVPIQEQCTEAMRNKLLDNIQDSRAGGSNRTTSVTPTNRPRPFKTFPARGNATNVANDFAQHFVPGFAPAFNNHSALMQQNNPTFALQSTLQAASHGVPLLQPQPAFNPGMIGAAIPPAPPIATRYLAGIQGNPFAVPIIQQPVVGALQRPAVQKPRVPNANGQQAYEEWIEWRKANEPGYAIECKVRQQRRSQRSKVSRPRHSVDGNKSTAPAAAAA